MTARLVHSIACSAALLAGGCVDLEETAPEGPDPAELTAARDTDPDPDTVEVWLTATTGTFEYLPGKKAHVWGYRDGAAPGAPLQIPGPLIEAKLGDLVRVHLVNELPDEGTTLHMHGLRLPSDMDGAHGGVLPGE